MRELLTWQMRLPDVAILEILHDHDLKKFLFPAAREVGACQLQPKECVTVKHTLLRPRGTETPGVT